jgi:hypothetical protein
MIESRPDLRKKCINFGSHRAPSATATTWPGCRGFLFDKLVCGGGGRGV